MVNLHLYCSGMQNVEMYYICFNPEKINFSTFPSINKFFTPCTHRTVTVTYSKDRTTYCKIQFTNQSNLEPGHERNRRRKKNRKMCRDMLPNTQAITALIHTAWYTQFSLSECTSQALFKCMESGCMKLTLKWKVKVTTTQTNLAGWLETEMRSYKHTCKRLYTDYEDISLVW